MTVRIVAGTADRDASEQLITAGQARKLLSGEIAIAEQIAQLFEDPAWAKAMSHPCRAEILALLREGPLSPARAAERLHGPSVGTIAYHFRSLQALGLIEVRDRIQRRGATEHISSAASWSICC